MENKIAGWIIVGISIVIGIIVWIFNTGLKNIVGETCTHGPTCSMYSTISVQTWTSIAIAGIILIIGIVLLFTKPKEKILIKKIKEKKKPLDLSHLDKREKQAVKLIQDENNAIFQATLMEKLGIGKVGITRLLDKLEAKQIIERKRRGMNNIVVLKNY